MERHTERNTEREGEGKRKNLKGREGPLASAIANPTSMSECGSDSNWLLKLIPRCDRGHLI